MTDSKQQLCEFNPRGFTNLGTLVEWHSRYSLGEENGRKRFGDPDNFLKWAKREDAIYLPVYLYDHSGLAVNTTGFSCPWDSGQIGWIYATKPAIREWFGIQRVTNRFRHKTTEILREEIQELGDYLRGED